jgi:hypothetical protein
MVASVTASRPNFGEALPANTFLNDDLKGTGIASKLGRQLDQQTGVKVATTTFNGQMLLGADFARGLGPLQWGYVAIDPVQLGRAGIKLFKGEKLSPNDVVPLRMQVEGVLKGSRRFLSLARAWSN